MRFSYCESLIEKKSFFIFKIEYFFENEFNTVLLRQYGLSKFFLFFSYMIFEFHNSHLHITKTFFEIGIGRSRNFAKLLLYFYQPHLNIKDYFFLRVRLFFPPNSVYLSASCLKLLGLSSPNNQLYQCLDWGVCRTSNS